MQVTVHFYSYFKDLTGCAETAQAVTGGSTIQDLLRELAGRYPKLAAMQNAMLIAVGVDYQGRDHVLQPGDEVSLFRPCKAVDHMKRQLTITAEPIDETALAAERTASGGMGAVVCFTGLVRDTEDGVPIAALEYEAFEAMARHQFNLLFDELEKRWPVESIRLAHRIGVVKAGEPSLWVEVVAPHRGEAFAACQWLIDEMKCTVPIWKKPVSAQ